MLRRKAFTLVELLVVIAIMAILLTLLTPALQKAREQAKFVKCNTNVKSLQFATVNYFLDEEKGFMYIDPVTLTINDLYLNELNEYIDNVDEARYCPSTFVPEDPDASGIIWGSSKQAWMWHWGTEFPEYGSYNINGWLYTEMNRPGDEDKWVNSQNKIDRVGADQIPGYADSIWIDTWTRDDDPIPANIDLSRGFNNGTGRMLINRHGGRTSVSLMDGHVESVFLYQLWSFKWNAEFQTESIIFRDNGSDIYQ